MQFTSNVLDTPNRHGTWRFSRDLIQHLGGRDRTKPFFLGEWLRTLQNNALADLDETIHGIHSSPEIVDQTDDIVLMMGIVVAMERGTSSMKYTYDDLDLRHWSTVFGRALTLEKLLRKGHVTINSPLSIDPDRMVIVTATASGRTLGLEEILDVTNGAGPIH